MGKRVAEMMRFNSHLTHHKGKSLLQNHRSADMNNVIFATGFRCVTAGPKVNPTRSNEQIYNNIAENKSGNGRSFGS